MALITRTTTAEPEAAGVSGPPPAAGKRSPWWGRGVGAVVAILAVLSLFAYHPPVAVVSVGTPIDVVPDITISGAPTHPVPGRYLLLWIRVARPDLAGTVAAFVTGRTTVSAGPTLPRAEQAAAERQGRRQYLDSRTSAVTAAIRMAGLDPDRVHVRIRDRGLSGPSAGLVYALAVTDLLGRDRAHGRTVAATGTVDASGQVGAVGWVTVKAEGAVAAGATILLVPQGEQAAVLGSGYRGRVVVVSSLAQAEGALASAGP